VGKAADTTKDNFLYNDGCRYAPHVMAFRLGEGLKVKSNDPKLHIPHGYLGERTVFNLSLPFKNTIIETTSRIRQPGMTGRPSKWSAKKSSLLLTFFRTTISFPGASRTIRSTNRKRMGRLPPVRFRRRVGACRAWRR